MATPSTPMRRAYASLIRETPRPGWTTLPFRMISGTIFRMVSTGTAKPIPLDAPEGEMIIVFIPMSSPAESRSGPPEFPGLMEASVWIISRMVTPPAPGMLRPRALTMPVVTVVVEPERIADGDDLLPDLEVPGRARRAAGTAPRGPPRP